MVGAIICRVDKRSMIHTLDVGEQTETGAISIILAALWYYEKCARRLVWKLATGASLPMKGRSNGRNSRMARKVGYEVSILHA